MRLSYWQRTICWSALGLFVSFLPQVVVCQTGIESKPPRPLGKLIDIGGWRLHLNCTGNSKRSAPTVVFESGSGDFSFDWSLVQPGVARFTRACSYDRAGNAWSDLGPKPRTMKQVVYELHTLLKTAGIKGPYVMVGQSSGGLLIRTFTKQYPGEVAGMVLVDSTHEDTQIFLNGKVQRMRELSQGRVVPAVQRVIAQTDKALSSDERQQLDQLMKQIGPLKIDGPFTHLPTNIEQIRLWALSQPQHYVADNDPYWGEEFAQMYEARKTEAYPLGNMPLIVLSRGKSEYPANDSGRQLEEERTRMQLDLLNLSRDSKQIVAPSSGHHIQLDDPALVIDAIRQVVVSVRSHSPLRQ